MRENITPTGHINVAVAMNPRLGEARAKNIKDAQRDGMVDAARVYGTVLSGNNASYGILSWGQNSAMFTARTARRMAPGMRNVFTETHSTGFAVFNGIRLDSRATQQSFEDSFLFIGLSTREFVYNEPGTTIGVRTTGLSTIWLGGTDVDFGDRLRWRLPSIDPALRASEAQYEHPVDGRPKEKLMAVIERVNPAHVINAPGLALTSAISDWPREQDGRQRLFVDPFAPTSLSLGASELMVLKMFQFAAFVADNAATFGTLTGRTPDQRARLYATLFRGLLTNPAMQDAAAVQGDAAAQERQQQASVALFESFNRASQFYDERMVGVAMQRAVGYGKCDTRM